MSQPPDDSPIEARLVPPHEITPQAPGPSTGNAPGEGGLQSRAAVFGILFLVTGVLGIPLLWMNRSFTNTERIVWSVIVTIYTAALVLIAAMIVLWSYRQITGG